jgi:site-specific recombinase XerD
MAKAPYIEEGGLRHLLKVAAMSGESSLRNVALLTTVYGTGMMLTEISRMPLRAYLNGDCSVRVKSCADAAIATTRRSARSIGPTPNVVKAIDAYLAYRIACRHRLPPMATEYRGLDPHGPIFLTEMANRTSSSNAALGAAVPAILVIP